jgi:hypothetical protein
VEGSAAGERHACSPLGTADLSSCSPPCASPWPLAAPLPSTGSQLERLA